MPKNNTDEPSVPSPSDTPQVGTLTKAIPYIMLLLLVGAVATAAAFYTQLNQLKQNPQVAAQKENKKLLEAVGQLIVLPSDEQPTIATVSDPSKLKDQAFFAQAKVGDKVLIYTNAKKAILYDPVANKILEVAPVNIGNTQQPQVSGAQTETSKKK
ncbi:MAG TPA: hypothetical protein VGQ87_02490 [Patescibacteria group bacterium]|jgi:hypothetical protein|nr:hypothetical protein [Patescibacteria group bacterium]